MQRKIKCNYTAVSKTFVNMKAVVRRFPTTSPLKSVYLINCNGSSAGPNAPLHSAEGFVNRDLYSPDGSSQCFQGSHFLES